MASCPICFGDLHSHRHELGALVHGGRRIEHSIYHAGCIAQMLACSRSVVKTGDGHEASWGLSPVTRKPVDGFVRMPDLSDFGPWFEFVDWKGDGVVDVEELAVIIAALLPVDM